jgi:phosphoglycolate phosphatase
MDKSLIKSIIFDFDGTLVDSKNTIDRCFQMTTYLIAPDRIKHAKNILIGPSLRDTASQILGPESQNKLEEFIIKFIKMHDEQVTKHTKPYHGVTSTLKKLFERKINMAIATNKRKEPTIRLINHFGWDNYFISIECNNSKKLIRNKDAMVHEIINSYEGFKNAYFVGDTSLDGVAAKKNKIKFIKANYGYGNEDIWENIETEYEINSLTDILDI